MIPAMFIGNDVNPCVYVSTDKNSKVIVIVYVDDLLLFSKSLDVIIKHKNNIESKF